MRYLFLILFAFIGTQNLWAMNYSGETMKEDIRIPIWTNETAPHSNGLSGDVKENTPNRLTNVSQAELFVYAANPRTATGQAVIILPGGGYRMLSVDNEGALLARWFADNGITAAVLKYRLPNAHPEVPLEDCVAAMEGMRRRSRQLGFDPYKVGVVGSSAGGHLAASFSTIAPVNVRPAFTVLFYPVISSDQNIISKGSFNNLLGEKRSKKLSRKYSMEKNVSETTPPAILFHCSDDEVVSPINSTRYFDALTENGVDASLYIFPTGGHGWGISERVDFSETWQALLLDWLKITNNTKQAN